MTSLNESIIKAFGQAHRKVLTGTADLKAKTTDIIKEFGVTKETLPNFRQVLQNDEQWPINPATGRKMGYKAIMDTSKWGPKISVDQQI